MASIGCHIVNPLGKEPSKRDFLRLGSSQYDIALYNTAYESWQAAEKEIKNYLILKVKE